MMRRITRTFEGAMVNQVGTHIQLDMLITLHQQYVQHLREERNRLNRFLLGPHMSMQG
jgi:hypothetical protein